MSHKRRSSHSHTSGAQTWSAGEPDVGELVQRGEVAHSLNALAQLLGTALQIGAPSGAEYRFGGGTATSSQSHCHVGVAGQKITLSFRDPLLAEPHVEAAATVVNALLSMAYAVDDLADGANYVNERLEQVLEIVSKTGSWHEIDVVARELLEHLRGQFEIDRAFVVIEPVGSDNPRSWLAEIKGDVRAETVPLERWERLREEAIDVAIDGASTTWPSDCVPCSVKEIMKISDKQWEPIITRPLGTSAHYIGLVGVRALSAFRFDSIEAQWLDILLTTVAGTMATLAFHQADAARHQALAAHQAVTNASRRVAHKLGNPTAALLAQIEFCEDDLRGGRDIEDLASRLREMRACAERIQQVNAEFRDLVVTPQLQRRSMDLAAFAQKVVRAMTSPPHRLVLLPPRRPWPRLSLDSKLCRSILEELIANAKHAMPKGGTIRVSLTGPHKGGQGPVNSMGRPYVTIAVSDEGPGVPPEKREEIFEPFVTTRAEGTGLGLAIVREYVGLLGGIVRAESRRASAPGTTFRIALPTNQT